MTTSLGRLFRAARLPFVWVNRHRVVTALVLCGLIAGGLIGGWRYAVSQWERAKLALKEERYDEARQLADWCTRVWPQSPEVLLLAARAARHAGELRTAEGYLNRCLELPGGRSEDVQLEFLLLRAQGGEVDELAETLFGMVEKGHPAALEILETVAATYSQRLRYKPMYACLSKWIELDPDNPKPYHWRGWSAERLNNHKAARADYEKAIELDPNHVQARLRIAEMLLEDKMVPEALPHLQRLMAQVPDDPQVQARMGICLFLRGESAEARRLLERAVVHLPKDTAVRVALANLDLQDGRAVEAEAHLRAALATEPTDTEAQFVLVAALRAQGRTDEAEAAMTEYNQKKEIVARINDLLKDKADNPAATADEYAEIGNLFADVRLDKLAVYWLEQALVKDDRCQAAHRGLAAYYERKGDAAAAAVHRRQLTPPAPPPSGKTP